MPLKIKKTNDLSEGIYMAGSNLIENKTCRSQGTICNAQRFWNSQLFERGEILSFSCPEQPGVL